MMLRLIIKFLDWRKIIMRWSGMLVFDMREDT